MILEKCEGVCKAEEQQQRHGDKSSEWPFGMEGLEVMPYTE
jgi:hypothetical protein